MSTGVAAVLVWVFGLSVTPVAAKDAISDAPKASDTPASAAGGVPPTALEADAASNASGVITVIGDREAGMGLSYKAAIAGQRAVDEARAALSPKADVVFTVYRKTPPLSGVAPPVRISLVADDVEVPVTDEGTKPFKFPVDERLLAGDTRILVRGAGSAPSVWFSVLGQNYSVGYGGQQFPAYRLGDARLLCAFLTAARKEMLTGANWLVVQVFGRFSCNIPIWGADPAQHRVWLIQQGRKTEELVARGKQFINPTFNSSYSNEALITVWPKDLPRPESVTFTGPLPPAPERIPEETS